MNPEADDDRPIRLAQAAEVCFRPGDMTVSGLRRERDRGNLVVFKIAGKEFTTRAEILMMVERSKKAAEERHTQRRQNPVRDPEIAQLAARRKAEALIERLTNDSRRGTRANSKSIR